MAVTKMGYEGILYYGTAGSTAATQLTNAVDIKFDLDHEEGDTTVRGLGTTPPVKTSSATLIVVGLEVTMLNDTSDASLTAMKNAAGAKTPIALRGKDSAAGKGPDADFILKMSAPWNLKGEQVITFTATPNRDNRAPVAYT